MNNIYILKGKCDPYTFVKKLAAEKFNNTEIVRTEKGKPYFKYIPDLFFSISHSGDITVVAIGDTPLGVDVEKIKKADLRVIKRFLKEEADYITECDSDYRFFEIWTKKEATVKFYSSRLCNCADIDTFNLPKTLSVLTKWQDNLVISVCVEV